MMSLRRLLFSHAAPAFVSLCIGFFAIELIGPRFEEIGVMNPRIDPPILQPGQIGSFRFTAFSETRRFDKLCEGTVHRWIVDAQGTIWNIANIDAAEVLPVNHGSLDLARQFPVAVGAAAGPAIYYSLVVRWCNPLQQFLAPIVSEHKAAFEIVNGPVPSTKPEPLKN